MKLRQLVDPASLEPNSHAKGADVLSLFPPFDLLSLPTRQRLNQELLFDRYSPGAKVLHQNANSVEDGGYIYLIRSGTFLIMDDVSQSLMGDYLSKGEYFGERSAIFDSHRTRTVVCSPEGPGTVWKLQGALILPLLQMADDESVYEARFAVALSSILRYRQGMFDDFLAFRACLYNTMKNSQRLDFDQLKILYTHLHPAIHSKMSDPKVVDYAAWSYAFARLPVNITSVFSIVMSRRVLNVLKTRNFDEKKVLKSADLGCLGFNRQDSISKDLEEQEYEFVVSSLSPGEKVEIKERRRTAWSVMGGKLFILLRDLTSDLIDVVSCLCLHAHEAEKLRKLLRPAGVIVPVLQVAVHAMKDCAPEDALPIEKKALETCASLTEADVNGLLKVFGPGKALQNVIQIIVHHGDYDLFLDRSVNRYGISGEERWMRRLQASIQQLIGGFECDSPNLTVDVISSNTHSVLNCVCPFIHKNKDVILEWGRTNALEIIQGSGLRGENLLYAIARRYFDNVSGAKLERERALRENGIITVNEKDVTGISIQLFDLNRLKMAGIGFDSALPKDLSVSATEKHLLLNIDFCFGNQAYVTLRSICLLFGRCIRSINVMGKAGGMVGNRGDVLFPTHIIEEATQGTLRSLDSRDIQADELKALTGRRVISGPIITVEGTLLQNTEMLLFYKRLWRVIGMEMEGYPYLRAIEECTQLNILSPAIISRFIYYISDTPLHHASASLSVGMKLGEGLPPLYGITRAMLIRCLVKSSSKTGNVTHEDASSKTISSLVSSVACDVAADPIANTTNGEIPSALEPNNGSAAVGGVSKSKSKVFPTFFRQVSQTILNPESDVLDVVNNSSKEDCDGPPVRPKRQKTE